MATKKRSTSSEKRRAKLFDEMQAVIREHYAFMSWMARRIEQLDKERQNEGMDPVGAARRVCRRRK